MIYNFVAKPTDAGLDFDIMLDKEKRVYCFIGDNAVGKTNLLENMAKSLIYCHSMFKHNIHENLKYSNYDKDVYDRINEFVLKPPRNIIVNENIVKDEKKQPWEFTYFQKIPPDITLCFDQPIVFIGAKNRGYTKNIDKNHIKILGNRHDRFLEAFIRSFNYMNGKAVENTEIADWFNSRTVINPNYVALEQNKLSEVVAVFELMPKLEPSINLITEQKELNIKFSEGELYIDSIPINKLSTGFVSIIKIFQEIIAGYGGWTAFEDEKNLSNVEGVVFIDEIESHLHLKWQYNIIPLLKEFFPKTIFYIATHSPLIVSATEEGEAYELLRIENKVTSHKLGNPKEWYLNSVYTQAFHVDFLNSTPTMSVPENNSLIAMFKDFSKKVKDYVNNKDEKIKQEAENLYKKILPSLPPGDPRRRSLDSLRSLL